ncbi:MAG: transcriptional repressor [Muribaculaceae bacterium]|nr:transcriptional repressor [Muribaculaceae bacterium]
MTQATQHLVKHGIRPSMQRIAIMKYLMEHRTHPTVDTIYSDLHHSMPTLSRTTVYNTLQVLAQNHAVTTLSIDGHATRYDGITQPHAHFMCRHCGRIIDLPLENLPAMPRNGLKVEQVEINFTGRCDLCNQ